MDKEVVLVFPHQLFENHPAIAPGRSVFLIEDPLYFLQFPFHKKKIVLHRASMKFYEDHLKRKKTDVKYLEATHKLAALNKLFEHLKKEKITAVHYADTADYLLERRLKRNSQRFKIDLIQYPSPGFLNSKEDLKKYFGKTDHYFLHHFYMQERKRLSLLMDHGKPVGGKWSFDTENRKKIPKGLKLPKYSIPRTNQFVKEAQEYVSKNYSQHYGLADNFEYPVTFKDASQWLDDFLENRFHLFGPYEDAMVQTEPFLFHSVLTCCLNVGLITPLQVVERIVETAKRKKIPLASVEGYIRQIIGWREFMRGVYEYKGVYQRKRNFWNHSRPIPKSFYTGTTGIHPIDVVIQRLLRHSYTHHIERLMVLGNFMLLCEFDPDHVYQWFMEMYIDAYDWVMVPNVYGMSQFADGGLMSTKPYFSGSNYILKMSDFQKGEWQEIWNALYWRFIHKHRDFFEKNQRTYMITKTLSKMKKETLNNYLTVSEKFLKSLS